MQCLHQSKRDRFIIISWMVLLLEFTNSSVLCVRHLGTVADRFNHLKNLNQGQKYASLVIKIKACRGPQASYLSVSYLPEHATVLLEVMGFGCEC